MNRRWTHKARPYLLILPALILAMVFSYRPFLVTILNSFHTVSIMGERLKFVGLENYSRLFASQSFQDSLSNTLRFTLFFVPANMFLCLSAALLANRKGKLATLNQVFFFLPLAVGLSSSMMIFKMIFNPSLGIVNHLLGLGIQWFNDPKAAMTLLVIAGVYLDFGFNFLLFHAALRNVPKDLIEVAQIEGASPFQTFRYLIFPLIGPTVVFVLITNIKDAMLISSPVLILTEGGPFRSTQTLVYQMYLEGFKSGNYAVGSSIATVVFLLTFSILLILMHLQRRRVYYQ
ncbi:carbohydrate ABC transporter permease [Sphaerochaeta sp. S2]|uniref:carbohydrate ABC transporter permease n=1 Tax=Sphaerochaeta sp. S2 TaxID=2798868 RepID=UPI0018E9A906|nr:sugar ABC transporter permease [Sphaerochaeta sp. S2]MBJ2355733.1 sugar ABC transporter permease [Sphaerochaeta sp. S2]